MTGGFVPRAGACGICSNGMLFPGPIASDCEAGSVLPILNIAVLDHVAGAQDEVATADDDFDRVVRKNVASTAFGIGLQWEEHHTESMGISVLAEVVDKMAFDGDDDVLEAEIENM